MALRGINMNNQNWQHLAVNELSQNHQEWQLVDIRDENAFKQGHIPGAVNLNNDNLQQYIDEHDFEIPLVVICYVGNSSKQAAGIMSNAGFDTVYSLDGGMASWGAQYPEIIEVS